MKKWQITGISKLTRKREVISIPCSKANAVAIYQREKRKSPTSRDYVYLKLEVTPPTTEIEF